jgi:hypothetical protein
MVHAHHYVVPESHFAVVLVGTATQSFDSPAQNLYLRLAESLKRDGVTALHVALCNAENLHEAIHDVRHGIQYLCGLGSKTVMLVGYDRGAAAVLHASMQESCVLGVVAIAAADPGGNLQSSRPLLVIYGGNDAVTGASPSQQIYERAAEPKELRVIAGAGHSLEEAADELHHIVFGWLVALRDGNRSQAA